MATPCIHNLRRGVHAALTAQGCSLSVQAAPHGVTATVYGGGGQFVAHQVAALTEGEALVRLGMFLSIPPQRCTCPTCTGAP